MKVTRLFITGGSGLLGIPLIRNLLDQDAHLNLELTVLVRDLATVRNNHLDLFNEENIRWLEGNIMDLNLPPTSYDYFIHMACPSATETFNGMDSLTKFNTIVQGTKNVLEYASKCKIQKFIFTSSGAVYGDHGLHYKKVPETFVASFNPLDLISTLGFAKLVAEFTCIQFGTKYGFKILIARCFSFIGNQLPLTLHYAVGNFVLQALKNRRIIIDGPPDTTRSFLNVEDFAIWIKTLVFSENKYSIYNVGSRHEVELLSVAKQIASIVDRKLEIIVKGEKSSVGNPYRKYYLPNVDRITNEYNLPEKFELIESLTQLVNSNRHIKH